MTTHIPRNRLSENLRRLFSRLRKEERADPLALAFARMLAEYEPEHPEILALTGLAVSTARLRGHTSVHIPTQAGQPIGETGLNAPDLDVWAAVLQNSPLVADSGASAPLVFRDDQLFLTRFWMAEGRIASAFRKRLDAGDLPPEDDQLKELFTILFPESDDQALAAKTALTNRLTLIAGGPGTGKTTTVVKLLALLFAGNPETTVALAAPTGKAANRLSASISTQAAHLPISEDIRKRIFDSAERSATLHRLLGYQPFSGRFRFDDKQKLHADVVIVDEASMIDVILFDTLLSALPDHSRLILLGDPDQLASVDAGFVFGDLVCAAEDGPPDIPLKNATVTLRKTWRFGPGSGIGRIATALRSGDPAQVWDTFGDMTFEDVSWYDLSPKSLADELFKRIRPIAEVMLSVRNPKEALDKGEEIRLLAATRWGPRGVHTLNNLIESRLLETGLRRLGPNYNGRPIFITTNDYQVDLFNGDVGVMWFRDRQLFGCFPDGHGGIRWIPPHQLPAHEPAWAMTIHKSQGSEFDEVLIVLPENPLDMLTRELIYTALTRARKRTTIFGSREVIETAIANPEVRTTGLIGRLNDEL